ncbi:MAG TPA: molybdopterin-dependent oxidoreductase [Actinomycetes bacterium]|nr:molybdopterin-dependent oxidoreductase [Actinomycetes bacterium]
MEELQLAARNHGMPLEALRYDVTPVGLHYLLIHFDIPEADERTWRLEVGGQVRAPRTLTMEELRRRPAVTVPVTMECAGNGRARLDPRPVSQPWLEEAVGTAEWTGTPLRPLLEEAGIGPGAVEVSTDGGGSWQPAQLGPRQSPWSWVGWSLVWEATPGSHQLCSRATDEAGNTQPLHPPWNDGGYANNAVQRVAVTVRP